MNSEERQAAHALNNNLGCIIILLALILGTLWLGGTDRKKAAPPAPPAGEQKSENSG